MPAIAGTLGDDAKLIGAQPIGSLMTALFYDLSMEKSFKILPQERRERVLRELIKKRHKPVALFIDDAHKLNGNTLIALKRLTEVVRQGKGTLSVVLAGHPKLKNDLLRGAMEEVGARTTIFELEGFGQDKKKYLDWLLAQVLGPKAKVDTVLTEEAVTMLRDRLTTPLQFETSLTRAFVEAFATARKPVGADTIQAVLAKDLDALEAQLMRHGYGIKQLAELLDAKPKEVRAFMRGQLPPERTEELHHGLLAAGVPL
jgi:type II secretory pathway predicted ATPase ExeA